MNPDMIYPESGGALERQTREEANIAAREYNEAYGMVVTQMIHEPSGSKTTPDKWIFLMRRLPNQSQPAG